MRYSTQQKKLSHNSRRETTYNTLPIQKTLTIRETISHNNKKRRDTKVKIRIFQRVYFKNLSMTILAYYSTSPQNFRH